MNNQYKNKIIYEDRVFYLQMVTKDFVFYIDTKETDENGIALMYGKDMKLISDNYFAYEEFMEILEEYHNGNSKDVEFLSSEIKEILEQGYFN